MMNKKEFPGNLEYVSPQLLIDKENKNDLQSFFLILGLIYNDLKGLIFFQKLVEDNYRKPEADEVSAHAGEYNSLIAQADKLLIATVSEFLKFVEENNQIINSVQFLLHVKNLNSGNRNAWNNLVRLTGESSVFSKIARVRSNVTFHYDHSLEELRKGFIHSFFTKRKDLAQHKRAYYSLGDTMANTRIYFSDAAAEDYIFSILDISDKNNIRNAIHQMNHTIKGLLTEYLRSIKR